MIKQKIITVDQAKALRGEHSQLVMCSGCYDIMHSGHAYFFQQCREFGSHLIVSVGSDTVIQQLKGPQRPINPEMNRAYLIASMQQVDYVIIGADDYLPGKIDFHLSLEAIRPHLFVLNDDDNSVKEKTEFCQQYDVQIKLVGRTLPDYLQATSTTKIIKDMHS